MRYGSRREEVWITGLRNEDIDLTSSYILQGQARPICTNIALQWNIYLIEDCSAELWQRHRVTGSPKEDLS